VDGGVEGRDVRGESLKVLDIIPGFEYNMSVRQTQRWKPGRCPGEENTSTAMWSKRPKCATTVGSWRTW